MKQFGGKKLTEELRRLGSQVHDILPDGTQITRDEALADLIWKQALGWTEQRRNKEGNLEEVIHPPNRDWGQFLYERREGKSVTATPDTEGGMKATDKVRELTKQRLNSFVKVGPPTHKPKP